MFGTDIRSQLVDLLSVSEYASGRKTQLVTILNIGRIDEMNNLEQAAKLIMNECGCKSISAFRKEALQELSGTAYISFGQEKRLILMLCITSPDQLHFADNLLNIVPDSETIDWDSTTMAEIIIRTAMGKGFCYEEHRNKNGVRTSLLLCATSPESIALIEHTFEITKQ